MHQPWHVAKILYHHTRPYEDIGVYLLIDVHSNEGTCELARDGLQVDGVVDLVVDPVEEEEDILAALGLAGEQVCEGVWEKLVQLYSKVIFFPLVFDVHFGVDLPMTDPSWGQINSVH